MFHRLLSNATLGAVATVSGVATVGWRAVGEGIVAAAGLVTTAFTILAKTPPVRWVFRRLVKDPISQWIERITHRAALSANEVLVRNMREEFRSVNERQDRHEERLGFVEALVREHDKHTQRRPRRRDDDPNTDFSKETQR